jgi:hypothetical protein
VPLIVSNESAAMASSMNYFYNLIVILGKMQDS